MIDFLTTNTHDVINKQQYTYLIAGMTAAAGMGTMVKSQ